MNPVLLATDGSPTAAKATEAAIELAQLLDTELVIGSHGWGTLKRALFGSVSTGCFIAPSARCSSCDASRATSRPRTSDGASRFTPDLGTERRPAP